MRYLAAGLSKRRTLISFKPASTVPDIEVRRDVQPFWLQFEDPADRLIAAAGSADGAALLSWHSRDGQGSPACAAQGELSRTQGSNLDFCRPSANS